MTDKTK